MVVYFSLENTILGSGKILAVFHLVKSGITLQVVTRTDFSSKEANDRYVLFYPGQEI